MIVCDDTLETIDTIMLHTDGEDDDADDLNSASDLTPARHRVGPYLAIDRWEMIT